MIRIRYLINGQVQGVGFRPFIYKLALELKITGFVNNSVEGVELELQGQQQVLALFEEMLELKLPPLARIDRLTKSEIKLSDETSFEIIQSSQNATQAKSALIPPDIAICQECLDDIENSKKYYNYFATNCTNCGPRYSIIKSVPYDRKKTSMQKFLMCKSCEEEYKNPLNRRYHAQPVSCNDCGPKLSLWNHLEFELKEFNNIYEEVATLIEKGNILAIKGIGGFHIVCDASRDEVVQKLRESKNRPSKPFALMCRDETEIAKIAQLSEKELELLNAKEAPIVVLKKSSSPTLKLSQLIAPNINKIGCFLPYSALHHLLFKHLKNPIVATSANLGNEPIITDKEIIFKKLPFVDFVLDFDRDIINGVDDSLVQVISNKTQLLRLSRGFAPKVIKLPFKAEKKILAVGANAKNAIVLVMDDSLIISPHIGDLDSLEAFGFFERTLETFKRFYDFEADVIVHDKHPGYETTKWAKRQEKELFEVGHHLAHIYACKAEYSLKGDYLGFSFDGTGYGDEKEDKLGNGVLWGGEVFYGDKRKYSFKEIKLLGGDKAIKEPRRVALSMLFDKLRLDEVLKLDIATVKAFNQAEIKILYNSYTKNLNAPLSSSVGRLFDGIASLSGLVQKISYEGESGLLAESFYDETSSDIFEYSIRDGVIDMKIVEFILNNVFDAKIVNTMLINTLVAIIIEISKIEKKEIILSGGVFQNKTLLELIIKRLEKEKITYYFQKETAINDGGIALGQAYYYLIKKNVI